eukprot:2128805-Rhodomonas_salina.1
MRQGQPIHQLQAGSVCMQNPTTLWGVGPTCSQNTHGGWSTSLYSRLARSSRPGTTLMIPWYHWPPVFLGDHDTVLPGVFLRGTQQVRPVPRSSASQSSRTGAPVLVLFVRGRTHVQ